MDKNQSEATNRTEDKIHASHTLGQKQKKRIAIITVAFICVIGVILVLLLMRGDEQIPSTNNMTNSMISSFEECVAAGNPVRETYPEQCVANGQTFVRSTDKNANNVTNNTTSNTAEDTQNTYCNMDETLFSSKSFGARFCYPKEWGVASVMDAKIDTTDTGYREAVRFSANIKFIVGGVSDDWTTTIGRDVGCQEPSNTLLELSSYNTDWNNLTGTEMDIEFAQRSLPSSVGGYDMEETVSNILNSGVCAQGHKAINGSRYRVVSAAYYTDFSTSLGILSPKAHIDNPFVLFSAVERKQFDRLLATLESF